MSHGQVASLTIVRGSDQGRRVEWDGERFVIGRKRGDLLLDDREVSGLHAAVEREGERHVLKDLGSTNGTFLEGRRIDSAELTPGCHLKLGATYLRFELGPAAEQEPAPAAGEEPVIAASSGGTSDPLGELALGEPPPEAELIEAEPIEDEAIEDEPIEDEAIEDEPIEAEAIEDEPDGGFSALSSAPTQVPGGREESEPPEPPEALGDVLLPAGRHAPTAPGGSAAPPRVGVTSHGEARPKKPQAAPAPGPPAPAADGSAWEALARPDGSAPIPPSPGAAAVVPANTPLPGELRAPTEPVASPSSGEEEARLPSSIARSPHGLYLVVEAGKDRGRVFPVKRETTILGRSDIDVRIDDPDVSRKHVALELKGQGPHLLKDLGSTNGTLLNGVKVSENLISPNDILRMGSTRVKLVAGERAVRAELAALARS